MWTLFNYLYRDAGNYKAFGSVALRGVLTPVERARVLEGLEAGQFFVAEQIGVPPLYGGLYQWSGGPTSDDHCWHEFASFDEVEQLPSGSVPAGTTASFMTHVNGVREWDGALSPHFLI